MSGKEITTSPNVVTPRELLSVLDHCRRASLVCYVRSSPGLGKSQIVRQFAESVGDYFGDARLGQMDSVDLRGLPYADGEENRARFLPPDFLPQDRAARGVLFLDEFSSATPAMQAAAYQLALDRRLGEYVLPNGVQIVMAGNLRTDQAVVTRLSSAMASRLCHVTLEVAESDWQNWATDAGIDFRVQAFIRFRPELLHKFNPAVDSESGYPCPRTWEFVGRLMDEGPSDRIRAAMVAGIVGQGAAVEFEAYIRQIADLPNIDEVLRHPDTVTLPTKPATLYALVSAVSRRASKVNADSIITIVERIPREFGVLLMQEACRVEPQVALARNFAETAAGAAR